MMEICERTTIESARSEAPLRPRAAVVTLHNAPKRCEHGLHGNGSLQHGERALSERGGEHATAVTVADLRSVHHHHWRRWTERPQQMKNARTEGIVGGTSTRFVGGGRQVHNGDVNALMKDDILCLTSASAAKASNTLRREKRGQLIGECVIAPTAVGQKQIQAALPIGRAA